MTGRRARSILCGMETNRVTACSICLRVLHEGEWIEATHAITHLRSFALPVLPRFEPALCTHCVEWIRRRREQPKELAA
jgi:hypothetical protein